MINVRNELLLRDGLAGMLEIRQVADAGKERGSGTYLPTFTIFRYGSLIP